MLVLARKLQEQIRIGDSIVVTVLRVKGNSIRLGIEAPRNVRVVRGELPRHSGSDALAADAHAPDVDSPCEGHGERGPRPGSGRLPSLQCELDKPGPLEERLGNVLLRQSAAGWAR